MVWVFVAAGLLLVFTPPRIRKLGFAVLGAIVIGFLAVVLANRRPAAEIPSSAPPAAIGAGAASRKFDFDKYRQEKKDHDDPDAITRIATTDLRFDQVQVNPGIESGTIQAIRARLYNDSAKFTLTDYSYYLIVQDCLSAPGVKPSSQCTTVYDQRDLVSFTVPPNQARDVTISLAKDSTTSTAPFKLLGTPRIELTPTGTRAYHSADSN